VRKPAAIDVSTNEAVANAETTEEMRGIESA